MSKIKILITGVRAPAALNLMRILGNNNNSEVQIADSCVFPLGRFANTYTKFHLLESPVYREEAFIHKLLQIITDEKINILIPSCEEIFYISKYRLRFQNCQVICDSYELLNTLHNKWTFIQMLKGKGSYTTIQIPETVILNNKEEVYKFLKTNNSEKFVFKQAFSRFASEVLIKPKHKTIQALIVNEKNPWIAQKCISGKELSSYSFASKGILKAHVSYHCKYRAGKGAGVYFEACTNESIKNFVAEFISLNNFTGHLSFDYIEDEEGNLNILECNPRLTSGIHLLENTKRLARSFIEVEQNTKTIETNSSTPKMLFLPMLLYNLHKFIYWDLFRAKDVIFSIDDAIPFVGQVISLGELIYRSFKNQISLLKASTYDIELNQ